jgi:hypothetical protein
MLRVTCYTGATPFERFTIDLSTRTHVVAKLDRVHPEPVIELAGAEPLPEFVLYPLPDQIADKVCAMYGRYGATNMPSTRYRDLVDLLLIATTNELDAMLTIRALGGRARAGAAPSQPRSKIRALSGKPATSASLARATCRLVCKRSTEPSRQPGSASTRSWPAPPPEPRTRIPNAGVTRHFSVGAGFYDRGTDDWLR